MLIEVPFEHVVIPYRHLHSDVNQGILLTNYYCPVYHKMYPDHEVRPAHYAF